MAALVLAACGNASGSGSSTSAAVPGSTVYRWGVVGNKGALTQLQLETPTALAGINGNVVQIATSNSDGYALPRSVPSTAGESTALASWEMES